MQKTNFKFEVLVGEDCSTDHSKEIIMEFEEQHPGFLKVFYRDFNLNKSKAKYKNAADLKMKSVGKYIITLEGDDYWTDEYKLQKQVDFLENNEDYIAVAHNCVVIDRDGNPSNDSYPECKDEEYSLKHFVSGIMPGQLATVMMRNFIVDKRIESSLLFKGFSPGDRLIYFTLITQGKIRCFQELMSAYRFVTSNSSSFSSNFKYNFDYFVRYYDEMYKYAQKIGNKEAMDYVSLMELRNIFRGIKSDNISFKDILTNHHRIPNKRAAYKLLCKQFYNIAIKHKKYSKDVIV